MKGMNASRIGSSLHLRWNQIILEGFKQAERVHGVRYIRFVGDGDIPNTDSVCTRMGEVY